MLIWMKKFLGILILVFIFSGNLFGKKEIRLTKDTGFGNLYSKSLTGNYYKDYGMQIVNKADGHPVRLGQESVRFEVQPGDCGADKDGEWSDCKGDRERHELSGKKMKNGSTWWYAWSIYFPEDHINIYPTSVAYGQFHQTGSFPLFMFKERENGYWLAKSTNNDMTDESRKILDDKDMKGKWNDILVNAKWSHKKDGFFKLWANGKLVYEHQGRTKSKGTKVYFKFGLYRSFMSNWLNSEKNINNSSGAPAQIVYYDEIRKAKKCNKLKINELGYSCDDLTSQKKESKNERLIKTLKKKILQKIMLEVKEDSRTDVKNWIEKQVTNWTKKSNFVDEITGTKSRKDKRNEFIEKGIKKFK